MPAYQFTKVEVVPHIRIGNPTIRNNIGIQTSPLSVAMITRVEPIIPVIILNITPIMFPSILALPMPVALEVPYIVRAMVGPATYHVPITGRQSVLHMSMLTVNLMM